MCFAAGGGRSQVRVGADAERIVADAVSIFFTALFPSDLGFGRATCLAQPGWPKKAAVARLVAVASILPVMPLGTRPPLAVRRCWSRAKAIGGA